VCIYSRCTGIFEDSEVTHVLDSIDPVRDLEIINEELMLKDIATVSAEVVALEKVVGREKHRKLELVCIGHFTLLLALTQIFRKCTKK
jgi:ribosome-binding ATPase YchF (GTP1/OBG family)